MQVTLIISETKPMRCLKRNLAEHGEWVAILDNIAANVRALLAKHGWEDQEFAEKVGVTPQVMSRWLNKKQKNISLPHIDKMAEILGVSVEDLTRDPTNAVFTLPGRDIDSIVLEIAKLRGLRISRKT